MEQRLARKLYETQRKYSRSINDIPPEETVIMQQKMLEDVIQENFSEMKKDFNLQNTGVTSHTRKYMDNQYQDIP